MARRIGCLLVLLALLGAALYFGRDYVRRHPQDFPWTALDLNDPVGRFTAGKIAGLGEDWARCRALVGDTGVSDTAAPPRRSTGDCGYEDGMLIAGRSASYSPQGLIASCPVAAALHLWETRIVQPAAQRHFGARVTRIDHAGSYSCRRVSGRDVGDFSEHASADALDVTGFQLAGGERIAVLQHWQGTGAQAEFLREVRDGACGVFSTVLSPDYNAAHRDHLHLDVARRGGGPWTFCR